MHQEKILLKAQCWAQILGRLPGVLAIFLSGSVAQGKTTKNSDIDFFVVARFGQIWTARFFVFSILKIFGQMRTDKNHAGKICPNHFITHQSLEIVEKDPYSANLFSHTKPLYDPYFLRPEFIKVNKSWIEKFVEDPEFTEWVKDPEFTEWGEKIPEFELKSRRARTLLKLNSVSRFLEKWLRSLQIKKIKSNPQYNLPGSKIVLEDTELRFHPKPKNLKGGEYKCCFPPSRGN